MHLQGYTLTVLLQHWSIGRLVHSDRRRSHSRSCHRWRTFQDDHVPLTPLLILPFIVDHRTGPHSFLRGAPSSLHLLRPHSAYSYSTSQNFETIILFVSIFLVNILITDGKSNWLEGLMLVALYFIIALAFW